MPVKRKSRSLRKNSKSYKSQNKSLKRKKTLNKRKKSLNKRKKTLNKRKKSLKGGELSPEEGGGGLTATQRHYAAGPMLNTNDENDGQRPSDDAGSWQVGSTISRGADAIGSAAASAVGSLGSAMGSFGRGIYSRMPSLLEGAPIKEEVNSEGEMVANENIQKFHNGPAMYDDYLTLSEWVWMNEYERKEYKRQKEIDMIQQEGHAALQHVQAGKDARTKMPGRFQSYTPRYKDGGVVGGSRSRTPGWEKRDANQYKIDHTDQGSGARFARQGNPWHQRSSPTVIGFENLQRGDAGQYQP